MKSRKQLINILLSHFCLYAMVSCNACDARLKHIDARGRIIAKDSCVLDGRAAWIVDLDMSMTVLPRVDMIFPLGQDTINGIQYNELVRVFCNIQEADTILFTKDFHFRMNPVRVSCPSSAYNLSSYNADDDYGYSM